MIRSLRGRLLLGTVLTMTVALGLLGLAVDGVVHRILIAQFDSVLLSKAQAIASAVEQHGQRVHFEFNPEQMSEFAAAKNPAYFELWAWGKPLTKSPSLGNNQSLASQALETDRTLYQKIRLPDGRLGRLAIYPLHAYVDEDEQIGRDEPAPLVVFVGMETHLLDETLETLRWTIAGLCFAAISICGAALLVVVTRSVHPVSAAAAQIESLRETDLARRIEVKGLPQELWPVIDRLNDLLIRLQEAFNRERAFTADIAHELRTPVAGLRATLEVCLSRPRDPAVYLAAIQRALKIVGSMQMVIESLLLLARADAGQLPLTPTDTDLCSLIQDSWLLFDPRANELHLIVNWQLPQSCLLPVDAGKLRIVLANLFDNAVSYTTPGGAIDIALHPHEDAIRLEIANTCNELSADELPRLFDRFWRKDQARSQTGLHAGLGLSLCQRLLALLGATIVASMDGGRFIVNVTLPRSAVMRGSASNVESSPVTSIVSPQES